MCYIYIYIYICLPLISQQRYSFGGTKHRFDDLEFLRNLQVILSIPRKYTFSRTRWRHDLPPSSDAFKFPANEPRKLRKSIFDEFDEATLQRFYFWITGTNCWTPAIVSRHPDGQPVPVRVPPFVRSIAGDCARKVVAQFRLSGNWSWSRNFVAIADERSPARWISCRPGRCPFSPSGPWNRRKSHSVIVASFLVVPKQLHVAAAFKAFILA